MAGGTTVQVDHAKMVAVVNRLDRLIEHLNSSGNSGSYAGLQDAAMVAQAVCTVAQQEMATFVTQYNTGFGAAAGQYQSLCQTIVSIRNAVAKTANVHLENDALQAGAFKPLNPETLAVNGGHSTVTDGSGNNIPTDGSAGNPNTGGDNGSGTTTLAPGELNNTGATHAPAATEV